MNATPAANALRWISFLGIVAVAVMRMLTIFAPEQYFDVDPAFDPIPMAGLGPAGSLLLDCLLLICCACGLLGEWLARRGVEWKLIALAIIPLPVLLWHGHADFFHLWRGMTWQAAILSGVVIAHLARDRTMRVLIIASLIAAIAPLLVRGISQVTVEHTQTIAAFEEHREAFLRDRGWEPGSSNALIYERRLRQPQPLGWFTTTNIFGSALLPVLAIGVGLAIGLRRASLPSGWMGLMILLAIASLIGIYLTGSKGASFIALTTIAIVVIPPLAASRGPRAVAENLPRSAPFVLIALPFLAIAGVLLRGFLPEAFIDDRSLLFRWHYLVSSAGIFVESPLTGIGPDGYQEHYIRHRLPRNPEEVVSSHSMFIDWLCMFGVLAIAWCGLAFTLLLRAGKRLRDTPEHIDGLDMEPVMRRLARAVALFVLIAIVAALMTELHVLDAYGLTVRMIGAVAFAGLALTIGYVMLNGDRSIFNWSLAVGAAAIVMHGQIEMTFFQPGFVVWAMCLLGGAGAETSQRSSYSGGTGVPPVPPHSGYETVSEHQNVKTSRSMAAGWAAIIVVLAAWVGVSGLVPALQQERHVRAAAAMLHPLSESPQEAIDQRRRASERLLEAYAVLPRNRLPLRHAIGQLERAAIAPATPSDQREPLLIEALAHADRAADEHPRTSTFAARSRIAAMLAAMTEDAAVRQSALERAISDARIIVERDPHGIAGWRQLGNVLWQAGRREEAADAYRRALEADANFELDPLKQLTERERIRLQERAVGVTADW